MIVLKNQWSGNPRQLRFDRVDRVLPHAVLSLTTGEKIIVDETVMISTKSNRLQNGQFTGVRR